MRVLIPNHSGSDFISRIKNADHANSASSAIPVFKQSTYLTSLLRSFIMNIFTTLGNTKNLILLIFLLFSFGAMAQNDLSLSKSVDMNTANVGDAVTFTLTVNNEGMTDVNNVTVTDVLPMGLTFDSAVPAIDYDSGTNVWTIGTISSGTVSEILMITAIVNNDAKGIGVLLNTAEITSSDTIILMKTIMRRHV